jgi:hypothetical protein
MLIKLRKRSVQFIEQPYEGFIGCFLKVSLPLIYRLARGSRGRGLSGCTPHVPRGV